MRLSAELTDLDSDMIVMQGKGKGNLFREVVAVLFFLLWASHYKCFAVDPLHANLSLYAKTVKGYLSFSET